ncbi:MDR family MFS transporter [Metabacillus endolithicus]|uniref:MDR family MFS transporter n=1 Tax=Metabacillus endolithicus TaxID=1535204 RepID=A0ABW5C1G1_9BACI|nr:MDR family MFS transporter [Metabacillus endolithicus]UPG62617.1 DHA2 family efflux MFS transporter permease subunit [Metabacillus endolithicus]
MNQSIQTGKYNRKILITLLLVGTFIAVLNQTILITALPQIMVDFKIDANKAQWLITSFMLTNGIIVPISAFLIARFTTKQLFFTAVATFLIGTLLGGISLNFTMLLIARFIQAVGAGIMMPLVSNIILLITPKENRGSAMGLVVLVICFAPAIGPAIAGGIVDVLSWRYLFYGTFPLTLIVFICAIFTLENVTETNKNEKIDVISIILSAVAFTGILYGLSLAGSLGWGSVKTIGWVIAGVVALWVLVVKQLKLSQPMIEFRVFKYNTFTVSAILVSIAFGTLFGTETIIPLYTQNVEGVSALTSGLILLPGAALMGIMSPFVGRITDKIGVKYLVVLGFIVITVSTIPLAIIGIEKSITFIVIFYTLRMIGTGLLMAPIQTGAMNAIPQYLFRHGVAVYSTLTSIAGSVGISIIVSLYTSISNNGDLNTLESEKYAMGITFMVITIISGVGLLLALKLKKEKTQEKIEDNVEMSS